MWQPLRLGKLKPIDEAAYLPPMVAPFVDAANRGEDLAPHVASITKCFGFDNFMYGVSASRQPNTETRNYLYTTTPPALDRLYDERSYIEIDLRIVHVMTSVVPKVWDQDTYGGRSPALDGFLSVLQHHGVGSGVFCPIRDMHGRLAILSLSSSTPAHDRVRREMIGRQMGDLLLFANYFHELFVSGVLNDRVMPYRASGTLSERERECLTMAARGLTGEDIAFKLSISLRTVQHHFDSIRGKLNVANRLEAVTRAVQTGIISP